MLEPIPFAGMVEIDESFDRTANHMAGEYVPYNEPVAWMVDTVITYSDDIAQGLASESGKPIIPLYTHPVKEELDTRSYLLGRYDSAKTLTDEEITQIAYQTPLQAMTTLDIDCLVVFARAILRKSQEK